MMRIICARETDYFGAHKKTPERINPELRPNQTVPTLTNDISGFNPSFFGYPQSGFFMAREILPEQSKVSSLWKKLLKKLSLGFLLEDSI